MDKEIRDEKIARRAKRGNELREAGKRANLGAKCVLPLVAIRSNRLEAGGAGRWSEAGDEISNKSCEITFHSR